MVTKHGMRMKSSRMRIEKVSLKIIKVQPHFLHRPWLCKHVESSNFMDFRIFRTWATNTTWWNCKSETCLKVHWTALDHYTTSGVGKLNFWGNTKHKLHVSSLYGSSVHNESRVHPYKPLTSSVPHRKKHHSAHSVRLCTFLPQLLPKVSNLEKCHLM